MSSDGSPPGPLRGNDDYCAACGAEVTFWQVVSSHGVRYLPYDEGVLPDPAGHYGMGALPHSQHCPRRRAFRRLPANHCRQCGSADTEVVVARPDSDGRPSLRCRVCNRTTRSPRQRVQT